MAITLLATRGTNNQSSSVLNKPTGIKTLTTRGYTPTKNNGGVLGGIGYVGEKLGVGIVSSLEGISDYTFSGIAKLFGADDWAEDIIKNDWFGDWYSHPEEWYNPGSGWRFAGDVAGGIGSSVPSIAAAAAAAYFTGGAAAPAAASFLTAGLGAAGRGTKEAYEETGELTGKEFGYGALTGITEGGIEAVSNLIGMGSGQLIKGITKSIGKETAEAFAKQGLLTTLGKGFAGEAFEESMSEILDPYWKRITYDPNAKNASANEILYAGLVGGVSGMLMSGSGYAYDSANSFIKGHRLSQNGGDAAVLETSRYFSAFEELNHTEDELFSEIINTRSSLLKSLESTGGKVTTVAQKRQLGALSRANTAATVKNFVSKRAINIVNNADLIVERLNAYGYKTADGKPLTFTAEELTAGYNPQNPSSIYKALQTNEKLRSLAVADATGQMMIDSADFTKATLTGQRLASQVDLNRFVETATPKEISAVSKALNIDNWSSLDADTFAQKITEYVQNGGVQQTLKAKELKSTFNTLSAENARPVPKLINLATDGMRRYSDGDLDIAVERKGDTYTIYDYQRDSLSRQMTRSEANNFLREYSNNREQVLAEARAETEAIEKMRTETAEIDTYARENIKDYASLNAPSQSMIRKLIREGRSKGVSDSDLLDYAKISAHSGIDIQFDKESTYRGVNEDGSADYADGFYEADRNRIVVNPESKRSFERLLLHELDHAIRKFYGSDGKRHVTVFKQALEGVTPEVREKIVNKYKKTAAPGESVATIMDETNAYYAEEVLSNKHTLEKLVETEPTLKDKILSFFKGASSDYADTPKLSGAAKKYYRTYKKLFDEFSARNAQNNATDAQLDAELAGMMRMEKAVNSAITVPTANIPQNNVLEPHTDKNGFKKLQNPVFDNVKPRVDNTADSAHLSALFAKNAQKTPLTNINQENMHVSGESVKYYALSDSYSEKDSIKSQLKQNESVINDMSPVANINYEVVDKKKAREDAKQLYKSLGYRVDRQNFGIIEIGEREINESSNYLNSKAEFAAWMAVPKVLKRGKLINDHPNHKNEGFSTYTIAAPVLINGVRGNVAVTVKKTGKNRYKTHRILMPDGSQFVYEKTKKDAEPTGSDIVLENKGPDISSALINSISQSSEKSNNSDKISSENSSGKDYALDIDDDSDITGAEVMSWIKKPESDGKLDLEATVARGLPYSKGKSNLTVGELRKVIANSTREKVYSKADALKVVNRLSGTWGLTQRARDEIADTVWQFLNDAPNIEHRQDMAHDIAEYIVAKVLVDSKTENPDAIEAAERLAYLRTGIGKISFSDEDIAELKHVADEKGFKQIMGRWGFKGAKRLKDVQGGYIATTRVPMDVFVTNIAREMPGMEHLEEMHAADAFLEIDKIYTEAYDSSKDKWISTFWDMEDSEIPSMISDVENAIMEAYENEGSKSKFQKLVDDKIERFEKRAERFKAERDEIKGRDKILGLLMNQASKMKDLKMGTYANATQHQSDVLRGSIERLARIQFRGNFNVSGTRNILSELRLWYTRENQMLEFKDEKNAGYYVQGISDMLDVLASGEGKFTKNELLMLCDVMSYFTNFVENYGKVYRKGRWIEAEPEAKRYVNTLQQNESIKVGILRRVIGSKYMQTFGDPMTVARRMDMYQGGFFTEMLEELREGAAGAQIAEMELREEYDSFLKENRKYIEKTTSEEIVYLGTKVPKMHLIGVYMTLKRKHARAGLALNGFSFEGLDGKKVRVQGFAMSEKDITDSEIDKRSEEQLTTIERHLTDTDKQYIKILEQAYNVEARKLKADRDMQRLGYTNAGMGYYYPIKRGNIAKNVDSSDYMAEMDRVSNSSFNKNTVRGARQELYIENADVVFRRHIRAVCQYSYLSPAIETYNRLYNLDVGGNPNHPISVATESANAWKNGNQYFVKLISDIQGIPAVSGEGAELLSRIRSGYAKFQLGANPKVWFTQGSSLFASTSILDADSIIKGASVSAEGVDKYCPLAKLRNSENTAAIAQAVTDTRMKRVSKGIDRVSDALMAPIGKMDRFVIGRLFAACQVQVESEGGGKVGTEENKIAAGKLLERVIFETQQNSIATERSAAMRSGNELVRTFTMFTADSMKVMGRVIDKIGEALTLKQRIKIESDPDTRAALEGRLKTVNKELGKATGGLVTSAIYMACVAQLFRWLYDKEQEEDEPVIEVMTADVIGNLIGGLPIVKDAISKLFLNGYDLDNYAYSAFNDLLDSASKLLDVAGSIFTGEMGAEEKNRAIRDLSYSVGQILGLPTRNIYNVFYGLTKRFSPGTAFKIDSAFYEKNYQTELNKAIERGDTEMSSFILSLMMGERMSDDISATVFDEILNLTTQGQRVLPKAMPDTVTVGDVEYELTDAERSAMRSVYSKAENALKNLISSDAYKLLDAENRALAIYYVYDTYYAMALEEVIGISGDNRTTMSKAISADKLAIYYLSTKGLESDKDESGKTISGSKRKKVISAINKLGVTTEQKLLLICAAGYSIKDGDVRGLKAGAAKTRLLKYIFRIKGLSAHERAKIAEMCGFDVVNGKIIKNPSLL